MIYHTTKKSVASIIEVIKQTLSIDGRVNAAWLFGSVARGESNNNSNVDLLVELKSVKNIRYLIY